MDRGVAQVTHRWPNGIVDSIGYDNNITCHYVNNNIDKGVVKK